MRCRARIPRGATIRLRLPKCAKSCAAIRLRERHRKRSRRTLCTPRRTPRCNTARQSTFATDVSAASAADVRATRAKLRVGVAHALQVHELGTGHGNMWHHVLGELAQLPTVRLVRRGPADVWLASGHQAPPDDSPLVVQVHEASWHDPNLRSLLDPGFA